jgi:cell division protein FtsN
MVANNAFSSTAAPSHAVAPPHPANVAPAKPAPAPAATEAASAAKPKPPEPTPTPAASSGGGKAMVQIGAFSSAALAQQGWTDTAHLLPGQMAGKSRGVEETSKGGKTFYRAYVGGFASKAEAADFCAALKAKAKPCFVK